LSFDPRIKASKMHAVAESHLDALHVGKDDGVDGELFSDSLV
jgi:hypothetical protein